MFVLLLSKLFLLDRKKSNAFFERNRTDRAGIDGLLAITRGTIRLSDHLRFLVFESKNLRAEIGANPTPYAQLLINDWFRHSLHLRVCHYPLTRRQLPPFRWHTLHTSRQEMSNLHLHQAHKFQGMGGAFADTGRFQPTIQPIEAVVALDHLSGQRVETRS